MDSASFKKRLATFNGWPHSYSACSPEKLALAGFHYTKNGDTVQCNTCGVQIGNWQPEDDPITEHQRLSPNCHLLKHRFIEVDGGPFGFRFTQPAGASTGPRYPWLAGKEERLRTFKYWPESMKQKPMQLAEAGFFYADMGGLTICFYCGVCCDSWKGEDVPWEEHAKLSPDCAYLQKRKSISDSLLNV